MGLIVVLKSDRPGPIVQPVGHDKGGVTKNIVNDDCQKKRRQAQKRSENLFHVYVARSLLNDLPKGWISFRWKNAERGIVNARRDRLYENLIGI